MSNPQSAGAAAPRANKLYFAAWRWHFYAGLYVIPFILMLAITGTVMVAMTAFTSEYGDRMVIDPVTRPLPVEAQARAAMTDYPGATISQYIAPRSDTNPAIFGVKTADQTRIIALDPATGAVLRDTREGDTWEEFADALHGELMLGKPWGDLLVEIAASLSVLLLVTGLYLAWPRDGRGLRAMLVPDLTARGRGLWKSAHLVIGTWISLFLLMFLLSGLAWAGIWGGKFVQAWSTFPAEKFDNVPLSDALHASMNHTAAETVPWVLEQTPMPASGSEAGVTGLAHGTPVTLETVAALARQIGFDGRFQLAVPDGDTGVWTISRDSMSNDSTDPTSDRTVHVDRFSGRILADIRFADYGLAGKTMAVGIPLHMGLMGTLNAVANILICALLIAVAVSGAVMWWKRRPTGAGRLAAPPVPVDVPLAKGVVLIALALSMAFPVLGLTLLTVLVLDVAILSRIPALKRALS
ncbi:PepSY-associated TM helix domain-containing protein [Paracoccus sp. p4-l81]|uniref:PepSY-associated TM helix domain-containing protein n=1 Tax=unclassified Paracoccus (in: a-proteobacteria) TaxID=2688777 RepID=UPI0035B82F98